MVPTTYNYHDLLYKLHDESLEFINVAIKALKSFLWLPQSISKTVTQSIGFLRHSWHWKSKWNNFHSLFVLVNFLAEHNHRHFYFKILPEANSCEASFVEAPFLKTLSHPKMKLSTFQIARIKMSFPHFWEISPCVFWFLNQGQTSIFTKI